MSASPSTEPREWHVCALYCFADLPDREEWRDRLHALCEREALRGTLILAAEGINGTVAGPHGGIDALLAELAADDRFAGAEVKHARAAAAPFRRLKVRCKREIVTLGRPTDVPGRRGRYVEPSDWNAVLADPAVTLVDARNDFEVELGTFHGANGPALDPGTRDFRDFPGWAEANLPADRDAPVAMFCTGGIRCEKATAWLAGRGYRNLLHLRGGILRYLEEVHPDGTTDGDGAATKWHGACFVFDERVAVGHGLEQTGHTVCRSCRMPLSAEDRTHEDYHAEISCPRCAASLRPEDRARRVERRDQAARALARGTNHIGADIAAEKARKRAEREKQRRRSLRGRPRRRTRPLTKEPVS